MSALSIQENILSTTKTDLDRIQNALNDRDSKIDQLQSNLAKMNDIEMSMELHKRQRAEIERKLTAKMTECDELTKALTENFNKNQIISNFSKNLFFFIISVFAPKNPPKKLTKT